MISEVDLFQSLVVRDAERKSTESIYEVNFERANSSIISNQLSYINTVSWIGGNVAVHMRKVNYKVRRLLQSATEHR